MTSLVSNPNSVGGGGGGGGGGRNNKSTNKDRKLHQNKATTAPLPSNTNNPSSNAIDNNITNQQPAEDFRNKNDKFQPTAEQMRIASLMSDKKDDDLKPQIEKIVELTGATREDAAVALYDCDNDMPKAIEMILDGESFDSEWQSTGRKKKTKAQANQVGDALTNGAVAGPNSNKSAEKSSRSNRNPISATQSGKSGQRGGTVSGKNSRKKEFRPTSDANSKNQNGEEGESFTNNNDVHKKIGKRGGGVRNRGATRGRGVGRGSRTFMNRGMHNTNTNNTSDDFPNSIETWTNNAVEPSKPANDDLNTMTVGNWSDVANNEDWSEDDWTGKPMETKVFTPSTKAIPEKDEMKEQTKSLNHSSKDNSQVYLPSVPKKNEESNQPTMSSIISNNIKRPSPGAVAGQALLQQIQQQTNVSQNSSINQYTLSQYSKQATESIKSLVGMASSNIISNEHSIENLSKQSQPSNQSRMKVQNMPSKIPESAVEMPSSDPIQNLSVHFGSLEFGSTNLFQSGSNDPSLFDQVSQSAAKKPDSKNLPLLSNNANTSDPNYRSGNSTSNANKNLLPGQVLPHLNDPLLNNDHRNDKTLNTTSYSSNKPIERKNDYISSMSYKSNYPSVGENVYSSTYQPSITTANVGYYSNANQVPFGNSSAVNQTLIPNNPYNSTYNNSNAPKVIRDMDNSSVATPQVNVSSSKSYDSTSNVGTSLTLMSNSTSTTNAIKNTLSSTKGVHNVPPGVTNSVQPTQVLSPYIMSNTGLPLAAYYPYDLPFPTSARDHTYSQYPAADVKYNRNSESDMLPVSSQAASGVQTASQTHNYVATNYPPGYGFYFGFPQGLYGATQPAIYPVPQAQNTPSANSAFAKPSTAANYGSHSYNSGYDSMQQTQDYVNKPYQQHKQNAAGDISTNPQNMYSKAHPQLNKNYDNKGFQAQAPPQMNLTNQTQSTASMSSAYNNAAYMLPHQQAMHHSFTNSAEPNQAASAAAGNQRTLSQAHKNISSNAGVGTYGKFSWS